MIVFFVLFVSYKKRRVRLFQKTIKEGTSVTMVTSLFGSLNGLALSNLSQSLRFFPGLIVLYPALISALGNIGSIIGSITTTKLALGYIKNVIQELQDSVKPIFQVETVALVMHILFGAVAFGLINGSSSASNLFNLVSVALLSNLVNFSIISIFALLIALLAYRLGLNPDNMVIPIISTISDTVATFTLKPVLFLINLFFV
jgi:mgtE-like transporter